MANEQNAEMEKGERAGILNQAKTEKTREFFNASKRELDNLKRLVSLSTLDCVDDDTYRKYLARDMDEETIWRIMMHMRKGCMFCVKRLNFWNFLEDDYEIAAKDEPEAAAKIRQELLDGCSRLLAEARPSFTENKE